MNWDQVAQQIEVVIQKADASSTDKLLNSGQIRSLRAIAARLPAHGVMVADEVGMGKTRIAAAVARAVIDAGGRVAFLLPPGLGAQWAKELREVGITDIPDILRSLGGYLDAWSSDKPVPWFSLPAVMISHAFANWRLGRNAAAWRWALLPLTWSAWTQHAGNRRPWGVQGLLDDLGSRRNAIERAAGSIALAKKAKLGEAAHSKLRTEVLNSLDWTVARHADAYYQDDEYRDALEKTVGVGLGTFDLIVIDEAHKSRDEDSALSRLLDKIVIGFESSRRLALTATPVELDVGQWTGMLKRIGVSDEENTIRQACLDYAAALADVRLTWRTSAESRETFARSARKFQESLSPYVLRRDKREDEPIKSFMGREGETVDSYRRETPIVINPIQLKPQWLDAVMAAEGLSAINVANSAGSAQDRRLRLTVGNGHGISAMMEPASDTVPETGTNVAAVLPEPVKNSRIHYWRRVLQRSVGVHEDVPSSTASTVLYEHPAILAAVIEIEEITKQGRKVLVFGRFTRPMKALEELLNARAMLAHLKAGKDWPQSAIRPEDEGAVDTALVQLNLGSWSSREEVSALLAKGRAAYEVSRKSHLEKIHKAIDNDRYPLTRRSRTVLAGAVADLLGVEEMHYTQSNIEDAAHRIVFSLCDEDSVLEARADGASLSDDEQVDSEQTVLDDRIQEEYGIPRGGYARRMYGETGQHTRRNLQLKFNRAGCFPHVLIAQSQVGREGLNLHEQCRDVVLLHPEWNPGVVEQQIGRVDRLGSLWCRDFASWQAAGGIGEAPRISIRPVMFNGTYDEHNWSVLQYRWNLLRGQLHGIIVSGADISSSDQEGRALAELLNRQAPQLSPKNT
jgi:hypothetical protein